jgi:hypothetical protein
MVLDRKPIYQLPLNLRKDKQKFLLFYFSFSDIDKKIQLSIFMDVLQQEGLLGTPYQRVYFADKANYYVGQAQYIPVYTTSENKGVYQLADDKSDDQVPILKSDRSTFKIL